MSIQAYYEWQRIDPENGLIEPWLTHPFMDVAKTWPLHSYKCLEFGAGRSTSWWRKKCKWVDTVEANQEWADQAALDCVYNNLNNGSINFAQIPDGIPLEMPKYFELIPESEVPYDLIINDGIYRTEVMEWAVKYLEQHGGILVADNWQQDFVWISERAAEAVKDYPINRFVQPGHINHEGKPWNTSYWIINKKQNEKDNHDSNSGRATSFQSGT